MQRVALQFWQVGAARKKADREAEAEARRGRHYHAGVTIQPRWIQSKYGTPHIDTC
jgi:hypothetical protein